MGSTTRQSAVATLLPYLPSTAPPPEHPAQSTPQPSAPSHPDKAPQERAAQCTTYDVRCVKIGNAAKKNGNDRKQKHKAAGSFRLTQKGSTKMKYKKEQCGVKRAISPVRGSRGACISPAGVWYGCECTRVVTAVAHNELLFVCRTFAPHFTVFSHCRTLCTSRFSSCFCPQCAAMVGPDHFVHFSHVWNHPSILLSPFPSYSGQPKPGFSFLCPFLLLEFVHSMEIGFFYIFTPFLRVSDFIL